MKPNLHVWNGENIPASFWTKPTPIFHATDTLRVILDRFYVDATIKWFGEILHPMQFPPAPPQIANDVFGRRVLRWRILLEDKTLILDFVAAPERSCKLKHSPHKKTRLGRLRLRVLQEPTTHNMIPVVVTKYEDEEAPVVWFHSDTRLTGSSVVTGFCCIRAGFEHHTIEEANLVQNIREKPAGTESGSPNPVKDHDSGKFLVSDFEHNKSYSKVSWRHPQKSERPEVDLKRNEIAQDIVRILHKKGKPYEATTREINKGRGLEIKCDRFTPYHEHIEKSADADKLTELIHHKGQTYRLLIIL